MHSFFAADRGLLAIVSLALALFWLDPRTREPELRQRLLGLDPTRARSSTP
ncbi:hypothetical protein [Pseudomonas sp. FP198]|jgi:hypothetical protein|uniref:hypothetical protein n=1 Tax=Pseudomonas sp. FP198 TaxID=2954084 RepID=UPI0027339FCF|nr:hypothetical protein [Pseudomonas sp. FP198]WLG93554.1 hypothetical protein PSH78_14090 [Pseudomonas sp. FP198]